MGSLLSCLRTPTTPRLPAPPPLLSSTFPEKYDVFLSFRGEDTRNNFTSHLKAALCRTKIQTFIDDEELDRGDEISPSLLEAIEQSKLSVIIFSKNYSSSRWCLDELEKIVECKNKNGQIVIPIFYHVDPSTVRKQCGNYALFAKHWRLIFQGNMDKLQKWKAALTEATNLSGWNSMNIMSEAQLVEEVVQDILLKLNLMSPSGLDFKDLVGIDKHIEEIESLLQIGSSNIRIVGIWGMGGIGKTTIAGAVFAKLSSQFESCCFVADVQKKVKESTIDSVRDEYLSILLEEKNLRIGIPNIGTTFVNERLRRKEVLVVFDDVGDSSQLKYLLGSGDCCFGPGSRVMVTSRDRTVFVKYADEIYEVQKMNFLKSLQLFSLNAFKQDNPVEEFTELSKRMVFYCGGISLALSVLGSFLYGKSKEEWESSLKKLDETSPKKIQDVLKLSYYGLDDKEQAVFLDIACFFNKHEFMTNLIGLLGDSAIISIRSLTDLCYISIWHDGQMVEMHDLIKEMGREIVCQESIEPGKRSRLWRPKDVCQILKNNTGTDAVECISLDMSKIKELHLSATAFAKMLNLRLLKFYDYDFCNDNGSYSSKVHISEGLEIVSDRLRLFEWHGYPWRSLPLHLSMENLVELNLRFSHLEQLWDGVQQTKGVSSSNINEYRCIRLAHDGNRGSFPINHKPPLN
ncbi:Disease resistance protein (TIR-NBS-LRR class) [Quillaja saponaria]|uniref:Disease resistance protein (TIR-NBS-LRR class) n=1 Tax=Quillaja saponaria TaxID=32244 RepID=A0AAD7LQP3_QUISA|nr:Disease resistance protein (TIR-NBS-LRR class) [Quillaja saponaria]